MPKELDCVEFMAANGKNMFLVHPLARAMDSKRKTGVSVDNSSTFLRDKYPRSLIHPVPQLKGGNN